MEKFHESRGEVSPRQRDCKRNVHDVALVGGSARIPIVQMMIQEFFNGKEQRFTELVVLLLTRTETVLPMKSRSLEHRIWCRFLSDFIVDKISP